ALESFTWDGARLRPEMQLGVADGGPLVEFAGMAVDADGVVWLTSARGLVRADPPPRMVNVFGVMQGLPAQDITTAPVPVRVGDPLHMSTSAGLVIFDPATCKPTGTPPRRAIKPIEVRARDGVRQLDPATPLRLGGRDHEMRVHARLAGFTSARHSRYRFLLH